MSENETVILKRDDELAESLIQKLQRIKELWAEVPTEDDLEELAKHADGLTGRLEAARETYMDGNFPTVDSLQELAKEAAALADNLAPSGGNGELDEGGEPSGLKSRCPKCGVVLGEPHINKSDMERCSVCLRRRAKCECHGHDPQKAVWRGESPWTEFGEPQSQARAAAEFFGACLMHQHRGVFDCGDKIILYGNDGYRDDPRAQREVALMRDHLGKLSLSRNEFATNGYSWAVVALNYQRVPVNVNELQNRLCEIWGEVCEARQG